MPLRWQLVAIYAVVLTLVVAGFSAAMVLGLRSTLERGVVTELEARARAIGSVVEFENGAWAVEAESGIDAQFGPDSGLYYLVTDEHGTLLSASSLARQLSITATRPGERVWQSPGRRLAEVCVSLRKVTHEDEPTQSAMLQVACGKDLQEVDRTLASLVGLLAWLGPLVLLLSLGGGLFLAGRALRPIDQITTTANAIGQDDLSRRIPVRGRDELATLSATLNGTFDRLQQAFERQVRFTADASHELRTPLAVVAGNLELAMRRAHSAEEHQDLLQEGHAAALQMRALIEGLLSLARADHEQTLARTPVLLAPLCEQVVQAESAAATELGVELQCDAKAGLVVRGDTDCLRQMLQNLLRNAMRYNRRGGHVIVRLHEVDGLAQLEVEDDGIGIPDRDLPHLGERFYRADPSRTSATGGVGLGLSIVKAIVAAHGGQLHITSVLHQGTRVRIALPQTT